MTQYKLTYFNGRGRAEVTRLIFAAAGIQYEDIRIQSDQWPDLKQTTPFGQVPVLEADGVTLAQSNAIARFLARKFNLAGKSDVDQARADMLIDCFEDTMKPAFTFFFEKDETKKAELRNKFLEEQLPVFLDYLEKLLTENNGGDGYFVADDLTWADLAFIVLADNLQTIGAIYQVEKRPKLLALRQRLVNLPKIATWLTTRPKTDF